MDGRQKRFWATREAAQQATTPEERAEDAAEMAPWERASATDLLAEERQRGGR